MVHRRTSSAREKRVLMPRTCDLIYIQTSSLSLLSAHLKPPSHEKMRGKHSPIAVWPSLLLFFVLFRPSDHSLSVPGHFSFSENFAAKCEKKFKKNSLRPPNGVKLTRKPSVGGGGKRGKKIDAEICALRNEKKAFHVCLFINSNSLRGRLRVSSETRKKCSSQMNKKIRIWDEKYFFIVVDFSRHISSVSFSTAHSCAGGTHKKILCTMDTHRFVCANFSHLFRRENG